MKQIESFLYYIRYELNYSACTVLSYKDDLLQFATFLEASDNYDFSKVQTVDIRRWVYDLTSQRRLSQRSVRRKIQTLRAFYKFLCKRGFAEQNPADDIPLAKLPRSLPEFVGVKKMNAVLDEDYNHNDFRAVRDRLIVAMLYETGMRRSELLGLADSDIDAEQCELKVHGKRNKDRRIPFCRELQRIIGEYRDLRCRYAYAQDPAGAFFITEKGQPVYAKLVYNVVCNALAAVTEGKRSPHTLRHSYASAMLNNGAGLNSVKELLGHESLAATQVYTHITYSELKNNYKHAHPRALKKGG